MKSRNDLLKLFPSILVRLQLFFSLFDLVSLFDIVVIECPDFCAKRLSRWQNCVLVDLFCLLYVCNFELSLQLGLLSLYGRDSSFQLLYFVVQNDFSVWVLKYGQPLFQLLLPLLFLLNCVPHLRHGVRCARVDRVLLVYALLFC